ncbi:MAG: sigma-54-dependent Fis family transcriptional regulator [Deltaproteobacteria bacterium]|nr:sigma-54-dependent Fis family transcriptional regulator [Deltaproteobacteria bacterium]MBI3294461.1 sigma-54-dependent Fis family transcriptional regulator [Deltaproteobacteria bacterium]
MEGLVFGASPRFRVFMELVESYASTDWPVLILGETGVGKELIARYIHRLSSRASHPLLTLNASALPPQLFESELFGYEKGAFSGAMTSKPGLFRAAHRGTLLLDEIGDMDPGLQSKLLRTLESGEVRSVGSTRTDHVDVRVIASTNADLFQAVSSGAFRHDVLERISVLRLEVPPLSDRPEDIPLIANHLCQTQRLSITPEALQLLKDYDWPGNVRQLRNVLVRAGAMSRNQISSLQIDQLVIEERRRFPKAVHADRDVSRLTLADIERQFIESKIRLCQGNKKLAAKELGISKSTLFEKIRKYKEEDTSSQLFAH